MGDKVSPEEQVRDFTRSCVRSGLLSQSEVLDEVVLAIESELPDRADESRELAGIWVAEARDALVHDQGNWPEASDYDRLQTAFAELEMADVAVLQGCDDHWSAKAELERRTAEDRRPRGIAWFTRSDVWHAVDEGMLEVNLWHATTANVALGDEMLDDVIVVLKKHGLESHFGEGRIEVSAHWQKRIAAWSDEPDA